MAGREDRARNFFAAQMKKSADFFAQNIAYHKTLAKKNLTIY